METRSVADIEGAWVEPGFESSLTQRCRDNWTTPAGSLSNHVLATFIRQHIAPQLLLPEAERRLSIDYVDDTELYDEELAVAVAEAGGRDGI